MRTNLLPRLLIGLAMAMCLALPFLAAGCGDDSACSDNTCIDLGPDSSVPHDLSGMDLPKNTDLGETD